MNFKLYKIKDLPVWQAWCDKLGNELKAEALETIKEEKLLFEMFINLEVDGEWYALGISHPESLPATDKKINNQHKEIKKQCLESIDTKSKLGYFLMNND